MSLSLIGRKEEQAILKKSLDSSKSEMIAVLGRRRVGKTFLVETVCKKHLVFQITGTQNAPKEEQLLNFAYEINKLSSKKSPIVGPKNWMLAFIQLIELLENKPSKKKRVLFFDEVPWLATAKSGFLRALGFFWNSWAVKQNVVVVICGSATSWMIQKVVNHTGGLHNRITRTIYLAPFTLSETEAYLKSQHIYFDRYQIVQLYMAMGGIPHYLNSVEAGKSAIQNIEQICFTQNGLLNKEFTRLYPSLFANAEKHILIIRTLAKSHQGMTRKQLIEKSKISNGGGLTGVLEELEHSGFISVYPSFNKKKKDKLYRLTDEYSRFYLQFIEKTDENDDHIWQRLSQTQAFKTWSGYAFESICLKHLTQIKKALGISGIYSHSSSFYKKGNSEEKGVQIDLLIDRNDQIINLVEVKFYNETFVLTKKYAQTLRDKMSVFRQASQTKKQLSWVFITSFDLKSNQHSLGLVQNVLSLEDLFEN